MCCWYYGSFCKGQNLPFYLVKSGQKRDGGLESGRLDSKPNGKRKRRWVRLGWWLRAALVPLRSGGGWERTHA